MQTKEAEQQLNLAIQQAIAVPASANLSQLLHEFDKLLIQLPQPYHLQIAGNILSQLAEICAARAEHLLETWEEKHNPVQGEPILTADMLQEVLRQTMTLNLEGLLEDAPLWQRNSQQVDSVVGAIDKSNLLEFLDQFDREQAKKDALEVAHSENVSAWTRAIANWMKENPSHGVSLPELQRSLQMSIVEIWLGLLLGGFSLEQRGEFYQAEGIWVSEEVTLKMDNA